MPLDDRCLGPPALLPQVHICMWTLSSTCVQYLPCASALPAIMSWYCACSSDAVCRAEECLFMFKATLQLCIGRLPGRCGGRSRSACARRWQTWRLAARKIRTRRPAAPRAAARRTTLLHRAAWRLETRPGASLDSKIVRVSMPLDRSVVRHAEPAGSWVFACVT